MLDEVAPRMQGLSGEELAAEVKTALDSILQREDVEVTPLERRRFVQEMMSDTLGYGPLDPLLADDTITEVMCNAYDDIWVEREGLIERTDLSFTDDIQYRAGDRQDRVGRRPARRRGLADGRRPPARRLPRQRHHPAARPPRLGAHDPEVLQGPLHRQGPHQLRHLDPRPRHRAWRRASGASSTSSCPAVPAPARRRTSTCCRRSSPTASASSRSRTPPSSSCSSRT